MNESRGADRPRKRLIIQLARFGDVLQTAPVVAGLRRAFPDDEVYILVDAPMGETAKMLPGVTAIHTFDRSGLLDALRQNRLDRAYQIVRDTVNPLNMLAFEEVVNLTHTPESACLTALTRAVTVRGLVATRHGMVSSGHWSRFFRAVLARREWSGYHLIDLHLLLAGVGGQGKDYRLNPIGFSHSERRDGQCLVGINLGANLPHRRWPVTAFAAVANQLATQSNCLVRLVGTSGEAHLAEEFTHLYRGEVDDLTGKTSPTRLARTVGECDLFLSGDSGTLHLAAGLGVQTIGIYLGMARPEDTAPYREGSVIFEPTTTCHPCPENHPCNHFACHADVPVQEVARAALKLLRGDRVLDSEQSGYRCRVVGFDETGDLDLGGEHGRLLRSVWADIMENGKWNMEQGSPDEGQDSKKNMIDELQEIEQGIITGSKDKALMSSVQEKLGEVELLAGNTDGVGLAATLFQLELEQRPADPLEGIRQLREAYLRFEMRVKKLQLIAGRRIPIAFARAV